jgi:hypothetical protein
MTKKRKIPSPCQELNQPKILDMTTAQAQHHEGIAVRLYSLI